MHCAHYKYALCPLQICNVLTTNMHCAHYKYAMCSLQICIVPTANMQCAHYKYAMCPLQICNVPTTNMHAATRNVQTIQDKYAYQRATKKETAMPCPHCITL